MPFLWAFLSIILWLTALPLVGCWPAVFLVPVFWVPLIERDFSETPKRFYLKLYAAMVFFWGVSTIWLPLPHWGIWFGWGAMGLYLAIWFPIFFAVTRFAVRRYRVPVFAAAPILWIGTEWFRFHILDGFTFCSLQHALYLKPVLLQSAAWFGEYAVGAWIVLIGVLLGTAVFPKDAPAGKIGENGEKSEGNQNRRRFLLRLLPVLCAGMVFLLMLEYGRLKMDSVPCEDTDKAPLRVALLQDFEPLRYPVNPESEMRIHQRYIKAGYEALEGEKPLDLLVWPEGTFAVPFYSVTDGGYFPGMETLDEPARKEQVQALLQAQMEPVREWSSSLGIPVLVGGMIYEYDDKGKASIYNTAVFRDRWGNMDRYDKIQRVLFGEYIPFVEWLPESFPLKTLCTPISAGKKSGIFSVGGRTFAVSICFESSLPHLYYWRTAKLHSLGVVPDFLLNVSNDGWFRGFLEPRLHQATYIFRAIENRRWLLAAVHGDRSMAVDPAGRIVKAGKKGETGSITVEFSPAVSDEGGLRTIARRIPAFCAVLTGMMGLGQWRKYRKKRSAKSAAPQFE